MFERMTPAGEGKPAGCFHGAMRVAKRSNRIGKEHDPELREGEIETLRLKTIVGDIRLHELRMAACLSRAPLRNVEHRRGKIDPNNASARVGAFGQH
jgi:hypothetical protein